MGEYAIWYVIGFVISDFGLYLLVRALEAKGLVGKATIWTTFWSATVVVAFFVAIVIWGGF